jgi:hypothetical protein
MDLVLPERVSTAQEALWTSTETLERLRKQYGWSDAAIRAQLLGLEGGRLLFPSQDLEGAWFYTTRRLAGDGPKYLHEYGRAPALYNHHSFYRAIYLCEGHSDTITALDLGYSASGLLGAWAFRKATSYLQWHRAVYLVMDADPAGWLATYKLAVALPRASVVMLWPPGERVQNFDADTGLGYTDLKLDLTEYRKKYGDEATRDRLEAPSESIAVTLRAGGGGGSSLGSPAGLGGTAQDRLPSAGALLRPTPSTYLPHNLGYLRNRWKA